MKMKSWVVWLLAVVFLVSEALLFSANHQRNVLNDSLRDARQQVADLQSQMDQLKSSMAAAQNAELSKLRADNQDLPRLRNQVTQLQAASQKLQTLNQKLTQQLNSTLTAAQQQQDQLQQLVTEKQEARTAAQASEAGNERDTCMNILRQIYAAKQQWALEYNKTADAIPTAQDIAPYIKPDASGNIPACPTGGTYMIGAVGEPPSCSIHGVFAP
jgi:chromosome segregation ATPase